MREMTVANIRLQDGLDRAEVLFLESARIYSLLKENAAYLASLERLQVGLREGKPVKLRLASLESDIIEAVGE